MMILCKKQGADMVATMQWLESKYGSIDGYLDAIGFDSAQRTRMKRVMSTEVEQAVKVSI